MFLPSSSVYTNHEKFTDYKASIIQDAPKRSKYIDLSHRGIQKF